MVPFQASPQCLHHRGPQLSSIICPRPYGILAGCPWVLIRRQTPPHTSLSQGGYTRHGIGLSGWDGGLGSRLTAGTLALPITAATAAYVHYRFCGECGKAPVHTLAFPAMHVTVSHSTAAPGEKSTALDATLSACEKQGLYFSAGGRLSRPLLMQITKWVVNIAHINCVTFSESVRLPEPRLPPLIERQLL